MEVEQRMRATIRKYALQNAVRYGKEPKAEAVVKKVFNEHPEWRKEAKKIGIGVKEETTSVATMSQDERLNELKKIAPELIEEMEKKEKKRAGVYPESRLPELPNVKLKKEGIRKAVVMRFAPNPNGAATLGSARGIIVNSEYAKRYKGKFILRFDDTDPVLKKPLIEAYNWYLEDCAWLDAEPDEVVVASERILTYYKYAAKTIQKGGAYVCFCDKKEFKRYKEKGEPCPHRDVDVEETQEYWEKMLSGAYGEKEAVLRIKTDMAHKDQALRDWVAFRILNAVHPRVEDRYVVWPTLDFESAIEDHLLHVTHIIRGKDLMKSEKKQRYLYDILGWEYPQTMHWGKVKVHEFGKFSTSGLRKGIEAGEYEGWDDVRLPTLKSLRRRGFHPEAIRNFFLDIGISQNDIAISLKNLCAMNKKIVDEKASRYFFVRRPKEMRVKGLDVKAKKKVVVKALKHPSRSDYRDITLCGNDDGIYVGVCGDDVAKMGEGDKIRLKYVCNVEIESIAPLVAKVIAEDAKIKSIIHWVPIDGIKIRVKKPEGWDEGIGEPLIASEWGNVVQFERYGFVRIDSVEGKEEKAEVVAYFTH
jgi:glutamyl-tRNA synthetase